jgi:putative DNA primase/helicase
MISSSDLRLAASGQWPYILQCLAGLTDAELRNRHQPCPACGGRDRYRFDDRSSRGDFFCNGCGPGDGFDMLQRVNGWTFAEAAKKVAELLQLQTGGSPKHRPPTERPKPESKTMAYALSIWSGVNRSDVAVANHPYAIRKGIRHAAGAGRATVSGSVVGADADCLVIPLRDYLTEELVGVECINAEGEKQTFGSRGVLILGNDLDPSLPTLIIEGWASAAVAVFDDAYFRGNACAVVAGGKSRLDKVAEMVAARYPARQVFVWREQDANH